MINGAYMVKGEFITCTNGHKIAEAKKNIFLGEEFQSNLFDFKFETREPALGTLEEECICKECGAAWFRTPMQFHLEKGGWT